MQRIRRKNSLAASRIFGINAKKDKTVHKSVIHSSTCKEEDISANVQENGKSLDQNEIKAKKQAPM